MFKKKNIDVIIGLVIFLFCVFFYYVIIPWQIEDLSIVGMKLTPSYFPKLYTIVLTFLGLILAIQSLSSANLIKVEAVSCQKKVFASIVLVLIYLFLFVSIGCYIATVLALIGLMLLYGYRKWRTILFVAFMFTFIVYLLFGKILKVIY